jgi:hypothetical protein
MKPVTIVVLAHYPDIFEGFRRSVDQYEPDVPKILVVDGDKIQIDEHYPGKNWTVIRGELPFCYSRNVNAGWAAAGDTDVVLSGDDARFTSPFVQHLQDVAYSDSTIAVAVPELGGQSPFAIGYWKRDALCATGAMDEQYVGYGVDDNDYCHRFGLLGYRCQPTRELVVEHSAAQTYSRRQAEGAVKMGESCEENWRRYNAKWGKPTEGPDRWLKP